MYEIPIDHELGESLVVIADDFWTRHVADSLQLLDLAPDAKVWVDFGSGGGFPAIPIACALAGRPGAMVHLVESNGKKAAFLREAVRVTGAPAQVHGRITKAQTLAYSASRPVALLLGRDLMWEEA